MRAKQGFDLLPRERVTGAGFLQEGPGLVRRHLQGRAEKRYFGMERLAHASLVLSANAKNRRQKGRRTSQDSLFGRILTVAFPHV
jgi:hypothetical protein